MKSVLYYGACLLLMCFLSACPGVPDEDPSTAWLLQMEQGETVEVNERLEAFVSGISDTRCPVDTECPVAGVAEATITLTTNDGDFNYRVNNTDRPTDTAGNYRVTFILMTPVPDTRVSNPPTKEIRFQIEELE